MIGIDLKKLTSADFENTARALLSSGTLLSGAIAPIGVVWTKLTEHPDYPYSGRVQAEGFELLETTVHEYRSLAHVLQVAGVDETLMEGLHKLVIQPLITDRT